MPQGILEEQFSPSVSLDDEERILQVGCDRPIRISAGHRILHHDGKCCRPHGHNYAISVAVTGTLTDEGWVVDKSNITAVISEWDHRFLVEQGDPLIDAFETTGDEDALIVLDHPPTAEVMSLIIEQRLLEALPETVSAVDVEIRETQELSAGSPV